MTEKKFKIISISVRQEDYPFIEQIKEECKNNGVSFSWLMVKALKEYFKDKE